MVPFREIKMAIVCQILRILDSLYKSHQKNSEVLCILAVKGLPFCRTLQNSDHRSL